MTTITDHAACVAASNPCGDLNCEEIGLRIDAAVGSPMARDELSAWLRLRGVPDDQLVAEVDRYAGRTEAEMDALYDAQHGSIA